MEIVLKKKDILGSRLYKLSKAQLEDLITNEKQDVSNLKLEENLVFYSFDYGYCLVKNKADKPLNGEEVWFVESFLDRDRVHEMYISEKQFKELITNNIQIQGEIGKFKGFRVAYFKAILE